MQFNLYIVSTPIGNLKDISLRAIEVLKFVEYILCEDTRVSSKLLQNLDIKSNLIVYNDHNALSVISKVIESIKNKNSKYALISDAGTPLVSDPGYKLVNACIDNELKYTVIPGASAVISALTLSGMPSDRFLFAGFVDHKKFQELSKINSTIIFFESPNRVLKTLCAMRNSFKNITVSVVREITKIYEESIRGGFDSVIEHFEKNTPRGEFVILLSPPQISDFEELNDLSPLINDLIDKISKKDLSAILSNYSGISKNNVYNFLLSYEKELKND